MGNKKLKGSFFILLDTGANWDKDKEKDHYPNY
jgi:hypothetical protein